MSEVYRTLRRPVQTTQQIEKSALSSTGLADDGDALAADDGEVHVGENNEVLLAGTEGLGEAFNAHKRRSCRLCERSVSVMRQSIHAKSPPFNVSRRCEVP